MAMTRMAGVLHRALKSGKRLPIPDAGFRQEAIQTMMPKGVGGWAWELGPDVLGAAAATAFAGPTAGLEDLALGVGGSFGGRMAGGGLAYGIAKLTGKSPGQMRALVQQGQGIGGMVGGMGLTMFGPRPFTDQIRQQQQEQMLAQQQSEQHWLMSQLAGAPTVQNYDALLSGGWG
jgi:hypothetical protein